MSDFPPHYQTHFTDQVEPVGTVQPGRQFVIDTPSVLSRGRLPLTYDELVIPIVGPFLIEGAEAGRLLRVTIIDIDIANRGAMVALPGYGVFGDLFEEAAGREVTIQNGRCVLWDGAEFPVEPMVGKVGVAVPGDPPRSNTVGNHGGNMDCRMVGPGSQVLLPVQVDGGFLYLGDAHARQADGECLMTAVEVEARITIECAVAPGAGTTTPLVLAGDRAMTIGHGATLDEAAKLALREMHALLCRAQAWSAVDAAMFMSAGVDVSVCQVVNPRSSAHASVSARYLSPLLPMPS